MKAAIFKADSPKRYRMGKDCEWHVEVHGDEADFGRDSKLKVKRSKRSD